MRKVCLIIFTVLISIFCIQAGLVKSAEIKGPDMELNGPSVSVSLTLSLDENQQKLLEQGVQMDLTFYINLYRKWDIWPDEFIKGKQVTKTIKANSVKGEFVATSFDGKTVTEKRFTSLESMLKWALAIENINFRINHLPKESSYFIRITVESHKRKLPKVVGYVFFFVNDREFKVSKDSRMFSPPGSPDIKKYRLKK